MTKFLLTILLITTIGCATTEPSSFHIMVRNADQVHVDQVVRITHLDGEEYLIKVVSVTDDTVSGFVQTRLKMPITKKTFSRSEIVKYEES